jgi:hypothetical protein
MSTMNIVLFLVGSIALTKKIIELTASIRNHKKEKISVDIFFLILIISLIALLYFLINS